MPTRIVRIGTRESPLALCQAHEVQRLLSQHGIATEIVEITSDGDVDLVTPLYEMGIQGIFTKSLDIALLQNQIDIAIHSTKDIPTRLAKGLTLSAMLKRATPFDCLVFPKGRATRDFQGSTIIATSSLRRKTQWLHRYPQHRTENLRGNIQTRLTKLDNSALSGAIFAKAALQRLKITSHHYITLNWMLPSPAQGAIGIVCREDDTFVLKTCHLINHVETEICVTLERNFLAALQGGCSVPIAALAQLRADEIFFQGKVFSLDAREKCEVELTFEKNNAVTAGQIAAEEILKQGADSIIKTFQST